MLRIIFLILLVGSPLAMAGGAGSALLALQSIVAQPYGQNAAIVELKGERGDPLPSEWVVLMADPTARGGVREVTVANGRITSERTPLSGFQNVAQLPALDLRKVTMDANALFQAVQKEAVASQTGFHWLSYTLRTDPQTLGPVWTVTLYDSLGTLVGTVAFSAQGGAVLQSLQSTEAAPARSPSPKKVGGLIGKISDFTESTARKVGDNTLRTVGTVQEFLVGERTIGPTPQATDQ